MVMNTRGRVWTSIISCKFTTQHCETRLRLFPCESVRRKVVFYASSFTSSTHLQVWSILRSCVVLVLIGRNWYTNGKNWSSVVHHDNVKFSNTSTRRVMNFNNANAFGSVLSLFTLSWQGDAVHRLCCDGFDIFIEEVVEIAWWRPQMGWCRPWWQTIEILYELTMVGTCMN